MFPLYHNSVFITKKDSSIILEIVAVAISDSALELWFWQRRGSEAVFICFCDFITLSKAQTGVADTGFPMHNSCKELSSDHG